MSDAVESLSLASETEPDASASRWSSLLPVLAVLAAVLLWGVSFSAMRVAVQVLEPMSVMWARMCTAGLLLAPLAPRLAPRGARRSDWLWLALTAVFMPCLYFLLESYALTLTTSSQAGVISASVPLLVAAGARLFLGEQVSGRAVGGLLAAMGGVAWLTLAGSPDASAANPLLGNLLELGAMACAAASMLLIRALGARFSSWTITALQTLAGLLFFLPGLPGLLDAVRDGRLWPVLPSLLFLGAFVTLGAFGLYNWAICRIPASRASAFINLVPVVAVSFGWLLLGEALNPTQLVAAGVVVGGVWLGQGGRKK